MTDMHRIVARYLAAAPRKKLVVAPLPKLPRRQTTASVFLPYLGGGDPDDLDQTLNDIDHVLENAVDGVVGAFELEKLQVRVSGTDSFSDGVSPSHGGLGYSFTMTYPDVLNLTGFLRLDTAPVLHAVTEEVRHVQITDSAGFRQAFETLDWGVLFKNALASASLSDSLPPAIQETLKEAVDSKLDQSITAYSDEDGDVSLTEYPGVYLDYALTIHKTPTLVATRHQGSVVAAVVRSEWLVTAKKWTFDPGRDWRYL